MQKNILMMFLRFTGCTFDYGLCPGWSQNYFQDDFDWTNNSGPTSSYNTGPSSDHSGYG